MLKLVDAGDCHVDELVQQTGLAAGGRSSTSCCDSSWRAGWSSCRGTDTAGVLRDCETGGRCDALSAERWRVRRGG